MGWKEVIARAYGYYFARPLQLPLHNWRWRWRQHAAAMGPSCWVVRRLLHRTNALREDQARAGGHLAGPGSQQTNLRCGTHQGHCRPTCCMPSIGHALSGAAAAADAMIMLQSAASAASWLPAQRRHRSIADLTQGALDVAEARTRHTVAMAHESRHTKLAGMQAEGRYLPASVRLLVGQERVLLTDG